MPHMKAASRGTATCRVVVFCVFPIFVLSIFSGCARLRETYYVGVVDDSGRSMQFYRFRLRGDANLTSTKYVSGWYSTSALDALLAEEIVEQQSKGDRSSSANSPAVTNTKGTDNADSRQSATRSNRGATYFITGPEGRAMPAEEKRLVILMSSDPEPVLEALKAFVNQEKLEEWINKRKKAQDEGAQQRQGELLQRINDIRSVLRQSQGQ